MSVLLRAITCATFLLLLLPVSAAGQALYADGAGAYLTVSPLVQRPLSSDQALFLAGGGVRITNDIDVGVRLGRFEDVPHGNPLPITYVGHTYFEASVRRVVRSARRDGGALITLSPNLAIVDRSFPVSDLPNPVTFREGRRVSEYGLWGDVLWFWRWEVAPGVEVLPMVGPRVDVHRRRESRLQHSDGQVGTMSGATDFIPALAAAAAVVLALDDRRSIAVEPAIQLRPGFFWIPIPRAGLSARVNL